MSSEQPYFAAPEINNDLIPKYRNHNYFNGKKTREIRFDPYEIELNQINENESLRQQFEQRIEGIRKLLPHRPVVFDQGFLKKRPKLSITADEASSLPPFGTFTMMAKMEKQHNDTSKGELKTQDE